MRSRNTSVKGFSLIELMISAAILVTVIVPVVVLFYNYLVVMESTRNTTVAVSDAAFILESMRSTDPFTISNVLGAYPPASDVSGKIGPTKLKNETVIVSYQDTSADPLVVTVQVSWQDQVKVRNRSHAITTKMTAR